MEDYIENNKILAFMAGVEVGEFIFQGKKYLLTSECELWEPNKNWDQLMPILVDCEKFHDATVNIHMCAGTKCTIVLPVEGDMEPIIFKEEAGSRISPIDVVYKTVVDFSNWWNDN